MITPGGVLVRAAALVRNKSLHANWNGFTMDGVDATIKITKALIEAHLNDGYPGHEPRQHARERRRAAETERDYRSMCCQPGGRVMDLKLMSAAAIFLSLACVQSANAAVNCGPGFHPTPSGSCRINPGVTFVPGEIYHPPVTRPSAGPSTCGHGTRWNGSQCVAR